MYNELSVEPKPTNEPITAPKRKSKATALLAVVTLLALVMAGLLWFQLGKSRNDRDTLKATNASLQKQLTAAKATPTPSPTATPTPSTTPSATGGFPLTMFGVSFALPAGLSDLTYEYSSAIKAYYFSTTKLGNEDSQCDGINGTMGPIGALQEYPKGAASNAAYGTPVATVGSYSFYYTHSQTACSDKPAAASLQTSQSDQLKAALANLK